MTDIGFVIATYYSGQGFYIDNNDYETLRWYETNTLPKPTLEELTEKWNEHLAAQPLKELRQERNRRLAEVDWIFSSDYHISSEERDVWVAYRQALRDLPSVTEDPTNPVWPMKPSTPKGTTLNVDLKSINDEEVSENAQIVLLQNVVFSLTKRIEALENA